MRKGILNKTAFIGKSLLWSVLLYVLSMAIINWDEVVSSIRSKTGREIAISHIIPAGGEQAAADAGGLIKKDIKTGSHILLILKALLQGNTVNSMPAE